MIAWITARLTGLGVKLAFGAGVVLAILAMALRLIGIGRKQQQAADAAAGKKALEEQKDIADETRRLSDADLDRANSPWVRK